MNAPGTAFRNAPGFFLAFHEAKAEMGAKIDAWAWDAVGNIVLPVMPLKVTAGMVIDLARFLDWRCARRRPQLRIIRGGAA